MSVRVLGDSINITATNTLTISKKICVNSLTFSDGTSLKVNNNIYLPDSSKIYTGDTVTNLKTLLGNTLPGGCIIIWNGTVVPSGWASCDGTNGTPNLMDLFIISTDPSDTATNVKYPLGNTIGNVNNKISISTSNLPQHSHTGTTSIGGNDHTHGFILCGRGGSSSTSGVAASYLSGNYTTYGVSTDNHLHSLTSTATGSSNPLLNILPPYYSLIYIMKL